MKWVLIGVLLFSGLSSSAQSVDLSDRNVIHNLTPYLTMLKDPNERLGFDTISTPEYQDLFLPLSGFSRTRFEKQPGTWIRFLASRNSDIEGNWVLVLKRPIYDRIQAYLPRDDGSYRVIEGGGLRGHGDLNHRYYIFEFKPVPDQPVYLYLEHHGFQNLPLFAASSTSFFEKDQAFLRLHWMLIGLLVTMFAYNFFLMFLLRDRAYFYYISYLATLAGFILLVNGFGDQYFPNYHEWKSRYNYLSGSLTILFVALFTGRFLSLKAYAPGLNRFMQGLCLCLGAFALLSCFPMHNHMETMRLWFNLFSLTLPFIVFLAGYICWRRGNPVAQAFLMAWAIYMVFIVMRVLSLMGVIPPSNFNFYAFQFGSALEAVLLSFALANRFNTMREQRDEARIKEIMEGQRREVAERTSEAKSNFLATMSHEIRTPMNGVLGMAEILQSTGLSKVQQRHVSVIQSSGKLLMRVLNDILDFSKVEAGKLELECIPFELNQLLEDVANLLNMRAEEKGLELVFHICQDTPTHLIGDPVRLEQVLINLVGNAIKFTEKGEILLDICRLEQEEETVQLQFSVKDTGIGMTEQQMADLFTPFMQANQSITRRFGGTGLGLAIVRSLVEKMEGQIHVESKPGDGSLFRFTSRFKLGDETPSQEYFDWSQKRVLVVDDNETNRMIFLEYLKDQEMQCESVASGPLALELLRQDPHFHLLILDFNLPEMSGLELLAIIREQGLSHSPALFFSSSGTSISEGDTKKYGIVGQTMKPFSRTRLYNMVRNGLAQKKSVEVQVHDVCDENHHGPLRILVVEDNAVNRMVINGYLKRLKQAPDSAENGKQALEAMLKTSYDLVFMDCEMPVMSGFDATRSYRKQRPDAKTPIIALTAHALEEKKKQCMEAGMDDFLSKPLTIKRLEEMLQRWA